MRNKEKNHEKGMMTVEAVLSLVPFILVVLGIISFINVFMVHNKIQYAMYQSGSELAAYTYFYEALGIRKGDLVLKEDIDRETVELDTAIKETTEFLDQIDSLSTGAKSVGNGGIGNIKNDVDRVIDDGKATVNEGKEAADAAWTLVSDPQDLLRNLVYYGIEKSEDALKSWILDTISSALIPVYLESTFSPSQPMTADQYLRKAGVVNGVKGLDFSESQLFEDERYKMIDIVVEYDLEISFFELFLKKPVIHVVQRCAVPAWLDGDGVHYQE